MLVWLLHDCKVGKFRFPFPDVYLLHNASVELQFKSDEGFNKQGFFVRWDIMNQPSEHTGKLLSSSE